MSETLQAPEVEQKPSILDSEIENVRNSKRGKITRKIGAMISGKDSGLEIVSGKEARLTSIKDAGRFTVEGSLDEARLQLEKVRKSRVNRMAKKTLGVLRGNKSYVTTKEATLSNIAGELQEELAPRTAELDQAYAMNTLHDGNLEEVNLYREEEESRRRNRAIEADETLFKATGSDLSGIDPDVLDLRRTQQDANADYIENQKADALGRTEAARSAAAAAEQEQFIDEFNNPRPYRIRDNK